MTKKWGDPKNETDATDELVKPENEWAEPAKAELPPEPKPKKVFGDQHTGSKIF
jgi:hypothetical protein